MSQSQPQTGTPQAPKTQSFKKKYKLQGMLASVFVMWLDYVLIYFGLIGGEAALLSSGMVIMLVGAGMAYYFG